MEKHCLSLKAKDDAMFKNSSKIPSFVMNQLNTMLNLVVEIIYLQQLEYEMERADLLDEYIFGVGYCGHPSFSYAHIQLEQATTLIISHFQ